MSNSFPTKPLAVIDIGTNSMHLIVARLGETGILETLTVEKQSTRLGHNLEEEFMLSEVSIRRALDVLDHFLVIAEGFEADVCAIATSAVREARNKADFLNQAKDRFGLRIETISGVEEARLIYVGVRKNLDIFNVTSMNIDIGGGSTEFSIGLQDDLLAARSIKLGCIRLTDRYFPSGYVTRDSLLSIQNYLVSRLVVLKKELSKYNIDEFIGTSGTISALVEIAQKKREKNGENLVTQKITATELAEISEQIFSLDVSERESILGLDQKRSDIITGGAALLAAIFDVFDIPELTYSNYALREGVLFDHLLDSSSTGEKLRLNNAKRLAQQLDNDPPHSFHVADLSLKLFDQLQNNLNLPNYARELLYISGCLHNIGLSISHSSHHKHSYYIIKNSEALTGFTERELEIIALVARFHRRSLPEDDRKELLLFSATDRRLIQALSGILRVATGLDRSHLGFVKDVKVEINESDVVIKTIFDEEAKVNLEVYSANDRADLLATILNKNVIIL